MKEYNENENEKHLEEEALEYHREEPSGKIEVIPTKPYYTSEDLSLAYSPGVAFPSEKIAKNPDDAYLYTDKGNLVGVISNGTAVLGLGNIGAIAGKPVMEGKALLFKIFAGIDSFDIEVNQDDPDKFIETVKAISPTFGGINLEDIKAPEAFRIEKTLKESLDIPLMHDDQHGTAIVSGAGLLNAIEIQGVTDLAGAKIVINGAGAAAISCARMYVMLGAKKENIVMCDSKGVIRSDRDRLTEEKKEFATDRDLHTLTEAMIGSNVFIGLSKGNIVTKEMIRSMASRPIVFALANPEPEISYKDAKDATEDIIVATGRSDCPNQINNVLAFPYVFRGALDVQSRKITDEMKVAAAKAIAGLAHKEVPEEIKRITGRKELSFGREYIIPSPFDPRLLYEVSPAVAKSAMDTGVVRHEIKDWTKYHHFLQERMEPLERLRKCYLG